VGIELKNTIVSEWFFKAAVHTNGERASRCTKAFAATMARVMAGCEEKLTPENRQVT